MPRLFFTQPEAAKEIGLSIRSFYGFVKKHHIKPVEFPVVDGSKRTTFRFTRKQVDELKRLREK